MRTRGIYPVPGCCAFFASDDDSGTLLLPRLDIAPHTIVLGFRDLEMPGETEVSSKRGGGTHQRAAPRFFIKAISNDKLFSFGRQGSNEFIVDRILNIEPRSSRAVLTSVIKDTQGSPVRS